MKRVSLPFVLIAVAFITLAFQCDGDITPKAVDVQTSKCGNRLGVDERLTSPVIEAGVYRMRRDNGNLRITHVDWVVPCDWHDITVDVEVTDNTVVVNECCDGGQANCLCNIENSFLVTHIAAGTYEFIFMECGHEVHRGEYTIN